MNRLELAGDNMPDVAHASGAHDAEDGHEQDLSQEEVDQLPSTPELDAALHDAYTAYLNAWKEAITSAAPTTAP